MVNLIYGQEHLDAYCAQCGSQSVFLPLTRSNNPIYNSPDDEVIKWAVANHQVFPKEFRCSRNNKHLLVFSVYCRSNTITKIGQYPSHADLHLSNVDNFKSVLPKELFSEYKKAIGLFAHGVGAGSMVYLRRIIEQFMIEPAHQEAIKTQSGWDEVAYGKARMKEKMQLLTAYLPPYLVSNPVVYSIISKGIHELTEKECVTYFPVLRSVIEYALTDIKSKKDEEAARNQLAAQLQSIGSKLS